MKIIFLNLFIITVAMVNCKRNSFYRALRVGPANHTSYTLSSNTRIPNHGVCATQCNTEKCLSFSYTEATKRCETYSRLIVQEKDSDIAMSQMFFSKTTGNCSDIDTASPSATHTTQLEDGRSLTLFCDMDTEDGPWTVIQRQTNGNFFRNWTEYKHGFGNIQANFWIGNDNLHLLTKTPKILRMDIEASNGNTASVQYSTFQVANEDDKYRLLVQGYSGNLDNAMDHHSGKAFSTFDRDNDGYAGNCAQDEKGGWWYNYCRRVDLNGAKYWRYFSGHLVKSRMMIR